MEYRKAIVSDYERIVELQNKNLISILNKSEQADGFLSGSFAVEDLKAMNDDLCIIVCVIGDTIGGYLCVSTPQFNKHIDLPSAMIDQYPHLFYQKKPLTAYHSFVAGPVCIDKTLRGQGVFLGLYRKLFELLPPEYDLAVTLIATDNPRSIHAHKKIGMEAVGQVKFNGKTFEVLARLVSSF